MTDTQVAIGTLEGITEKPSGWTTIAVSLPGKQYPLKMDTKIPKLVEAARAAGNNVMAWHYSEHDSGTPNPNRPGSNYVNRRFEKVDTANGGEANNDPAEPSAAAAQTTAPAGRARTTDRSIERQVILKEMVSHYPGLDKLTVDGWWALMAALDAFMQDGVPAAIPAPEDDVPFQ